MAKYLIEGLERQETRMVDTSTIGIPFHSNKYKKYNAWSKSYNYQYETRNIGRFELHQWFYRLDISDNDELIITIAEYVSPQQWYIRDNNNIAYIPMVKEGHNRSYRRYYVGSDIGIVRSDGGNIFTWLDIDIQLGNSKNPQYFKNVYYVTPRDTSKEFDPLKNFYNRYFTGNHIEDARNNIIYRKTLFSK